jgi:nucleoside-diphosphate-sugar epimerase
LDSGPIRSVALDAAAPDALSAALGDGVDALIDCVAYSGDDARTLLAVEKQVGATVAISSSSVYRDESGRTLDEAASTGFPMFDGPIRETNSTVAPGPQTYSTRKAELERVLLDGAKMPVTILRPCAIYGPHSSHPRELWFVKRMLD